MHHAFLRVPILISTKFTKPPQTLIPESQPHCWLARAHSLGGPTLLTSSYCTSGEVLSVREEPGAVCSQTNPVTSGDRERLARGN